MQTKTFTETMWIVQLLNATGVKRCIKNCWEGEKIEKKDVARMRNEIIHKMHAYIRSYLRVYPPNILHFCKSECEIRIRKLNWWKKRTIIANNTNKRIGTYKTRTARVFFLLKFPRKNNNIESTNFRVKSTKKAL